MKIKKGKAKFRPIIIELEDEEELKFFYAFMRTASKWYQEDYDFMDSAVKLFYLTFPEEIVDNNNNDNLVYGIIIGLKKFLGIK